MSKQTTTTFENNTTTQKVKNHYDDLPATEFTINTSSANNALDAFPMILELHNKLNNKRNENLKNISQANTKAQPLNSNSDCFAEITNIGKQKLNIESPNLNSNTDFKETNLQTNSIDLNHPDSSCFSGLDRKNLISEKDSVDINNNNDNTTTHTNENINNNTNDNVNKSTGDNTNMNKCINKNININNECLRPEQTSSLNTSNYNYIQSNFQISNAQHSNAIHNSTPKSRNLSLNTNNHFLDSDRKSSLKSPSKKVSLTSRTQKSYKKNDDIDEYNDTDTDTEYTPKSTKNKELKSKRSDIIPMSSDEISRNVLSSRIRTKYRTRHSRKRAKEAKQIYLEHPDWTPGRIKQEVNIRLVSWENEQRIQLQKELESLNEMQGNALLMRVSNLSTRTIDPLSTIPTPDSMTSDSEICPKSNKSNSKTSTPTSSTSISSIINWKGALNMSLGKRKRSTSFCSQPGSKSKRGSHKIEFDNNSLFNTPTNSIQSIPSSEIRNMIPQPDFSFKSHNLYSATRDNHNNFLPQPKLPSYQFPSLNFPPLNDYFSDFSDLRTTTPLQSDVRLQRIIPENETINKHSTPSPRVNSPSITRVGYTHDNLVNGQYSNLSGNVNCQPIHVNEYPNSFKYSPFPKQNQGRDMMSNVRTELNPILQSWAMPIPLPNSNTTALNTNYNHSNNNNNDNNNNNNKSSLIGSMQFIPHSTSTPLNSYNSTYK